LKEIARVLKTNGRLVICHTMSREMVNQLHQSIGGAVATDLIPDESQLRRLIKQAGLKTTHYEDSPERYLIVAGKSAPNG
jgi:demethylmenaquinone methyltransferase/2-methoxy-6-polyprenyl-1,4-benzoquinol methylase